MFSGNSGSVLLNAQQILEHNEDLIAAVVENLQIGRLEDCFRHYAVLQSNLVALASELDNYPPGDTDPYEAILTFPDEIVRKNILDDLKPFDERVLPKAPEPPLCELCASSKQMSEEKCRLELEHIEPSCKFTTDEREDFIRVTQVLGSRYRQHSIDAIVGRGNKKRNYRKWSANEIHTLLVAVSIYGIKNITELSSVMGDRNNEMIRSFIRHFSKSSPEVLADAIKGKLPEPPAGYQPPIRLAHVYADPSKVMDTMSIMAGPLSCIAPKEGGTNWLSLVSMATASNNPTMSQTRTAIYQNNKGDDTFNTKKNPPFTNPTNISKMAVQSYSSKSANPSSQSRMLANSDYMSEKSMTSSSCVSSKTPSSLFLNVNPTQDKDYWRTPANYSLVPPGSQVSQEILTTVQDTHQVSSSIMPPFCQNGTSSSRSRDNRVSTHLDLDRTRIEDKTYQDRDSGTKGAATTNSNERKKYSSRVQQTSLNSRSPSPNQTRALLSETPSDLLLGLETRNTKDTDVPYNSYTTNSSSQSRKVNEVIPTNDKIGIKACSASKKSRSKKLTDRNVHNVEASTTFASSGPEIDDISVHRDAPFTSLLLLASSQSFTRPKASSIRHEPSTGLPINNCTSSSLISSLSHTGYEESEYVSLNGCSIFEGSGELSLFPGLLNENSFM